jgi:integrase
LEELVEKLQKARAGKSPQTQATDRAIIKKLQDTWPYDYRMKVTDIRPSHLNEWLALHEKRLKHTSYNRYTGLLKQLFAIAVEDRVIVESPATKLRTAWKRPQTPKRHVPTIAQFEALVRSIREQSYSDTAEETADFVEFLGLAGVGQAEAANLTWGDIDWRKEQISFRRCKTQQLYFVPFYHHLKPLLNRLLEKKPKGSTPKTKVFRIKDAKAALTSACKRLKFDPPFSQRNLRQSLIQRLWQAGVDVKLIAKWQGHQDGGQLILDTYTETFGSGDQDHVDNQLAKLVPPLQQETPSPHTSLGWIDLTPGGKLSYEEQQLRLLESFDPDAPMRKGTLIWQEKEKCWKVEP